MEAGKFNDYSLDIVQALKQLKEYTILTKSIAQLHGAVTVCYYPNKQPDKATDAEGYKLLLTLRTTAVKSDNKVHERRLKT